MPVDKKYFDSVQVFELFHKDDTDTVIGYVSLKDGAYADQAEYTAVESEFPEAYHRGDIVMVARAKFKGKSSGSSILERLKKA
jgi:hypothetical protein